MKKLLLTLACALAVLPFAWGQDTSAQESRKNRLEREIAQIEQQLKENGKRSSNAMRDLTLVRKKVSNRKALVAESEREIASLEDSIRVRRKEADRLQARLDTMTFYYSRLVRNAYKNRDARVWYMYILSSGSVSQAVRRYAYLRNISGQMNAQAVRIRGTKAELEKRLEELGAMKSRAVELKSRRQKELAAMQKEEKTASGLVTKLGKDKKKYQKELATRKKQVDALNKEIARIIAEAVKQSKDGSGAKAKKPVDTKLSAEFAQNRGKLPWPCEGPVLEAFGQHNHPVYKNIKMPFNNGINIGVSAGTAVCAVFDGEVRKVIVMPGYNKCVLVQHGGYFTFYCKLGTVSVKAGEKVKTGQQIGVVDTIDGSTQLHFQVWEGSVPEDPQKWLR